MKTKKVGTITLSDKVRVTDPCYDIDTWCAGTLDNVLPGEFNCSYNHDTKKWFNDKKYERVTAIEVHHKDYPNIKATEYMKDIDVGVDSGQAGIFDFEMFSDVCSDDERKEKFYDTVCDLTSYDTDAEYVSFPQSEYYDEKFKDYKDALDLDNIVDNTLSFSMIRNNLLKKGFAVNELYYEFTDKYFEYLQDRMRREQACKDIPCGNTIYDKGLVSASGDGDGGYACFVGRNESGQIVAIKIDYYPDYDKLLNCKEQENERNCY